MPRELHNLMVLGATSNAGKSLLATALCRWFQQQGFEVHPFKSQNMSLNAVVTPEGHEIGVAQNAQALAAKQIPSHLHNPILLKPQGGHSSQIIVQGKVKNSLTAKEYYKQKDTFSSYAIQSFKELEKVADLIILEGAGSPVELNLMERDIANLFMARKAKAKCLLVVNIEMGGFFASTLGTLELLPPEDKKQMIGVVVNNFRGDPSLFMEDLSDFEQRIGLPILGVLPHIEELALDVEDSLSLNKFTAPSETAYQIRIIKFPHIANFNEFQIFEHCPEISWAFTDQAQDIEAADLVILPGSKTTLKDLAWLKEKGLNNALKKYVDKGGSLVGICAGFQMMGEFLNDPEGVEGNQAQQAEGLGFFKMTTTFSSNKILHDVRCRLPNHHQDLKAFELHMGNGKVHGCQTWITITQRESKSTHDIGGWKNNNLYGSYLHGLFENKDILENVLGPGKWLDMHELRENTYNQLAETINIHLDMEKMTNSLKFTS